MTFNPENQPKHFTLVSPLLIKTFDCIEDCREAIQTLIIDEVFSNFPDHITDDTSEFSLQESFDENIFELDYHSETDLTDTFSDTLDTLFRKTSNETDDLTTKLLKLIDAKVFPGVILIDGTDELKALIKNDFDVKTSNYYIGKDLFILHDDTHTHEYCLWVYNTDNHGNINSDIKGNYINEQISEIDYYPNPDEPTATVTDVIYEEPLSQDAIDDLKTKDVTTIVKELTQVFLDELPAK